jgi:hypothetical protein
MTGFQIRVEGSQGMGDDTGMNGFKMFCEMGDTEQYSGLWGGWHSKRSCASGFTAFQQKIESAGGDDTAMNDINLYQAGCGAQTGCGNCGWGDWGSWSYCPSGAYICGFRLKFEGHQGGGDDTAANSVEFKCCQDCGAGLFTPATATAACIGCGAGHYNDQTGRTGCKACGIGKYQKSSGKTECTRCAPGKYQDR